VITTSETMKAIINQRSGGQDKTQSLPNNIATQALAIHLPNIRQDTVRIATLSVLNPRKNQLSVLKALQQLPTQNWDYLLIASDNSGRDYQAELQTFVAGNGLTERVKFLGWRDDVPAILQRCHLLLLPTLHEGSPNALLEAMGYGLPCLASDIPEIREILPDPELLFDPHDPTELTHKLERFLQLPGYAGVIQAKTAQCKARYTFDWDQRLVALVDAAADG
jgi:glycosyltransferase involved in cell wall biosynthesis